MSARRGYTFVELLLVLGILALLAGIAWPAVVRFSGEQAIKDAAELVRSELDRTRFRAVHAGVAYQFRYEPNGRKFLAVPAERDAAAPASRTLVQTGEKRAVFSGEIRDGLTFQPDPASPPAGQTVAMDWLSGLPDAAQLTQARWSAPILYRPDGTAVETRFRIVDGKRRFIELEVRDLTGMAAAGPLRQEATR